MNRLHFVVARKGDKVTLAYAGESGAAADAAFEGAKGVDEVEHYRLPQPDRVRSGDKPTRETQIRVRGAEPEPAAKPAEKA